MKHPLRRLVVLTAACLAVPATALAAGVAGPAASPATTPPGSEAAVAQGWPRTITHELGETVIEAQPENIVSTSITLTGSLLAIGAPVTASAATTVSEGLTDENGFFAQWGDVAVERGVEVLYPNLELDLEAIIAAEPDLIVVSTSGADSTADHYDELSEIAPTIVLNYGGNSWETIATQLGEATGLEAEAAATITSYDEAVAATAEAITLPDPATVSLVVYNGESGDSAVAKTGSAQGQVFGELGFEVIEAPEEYDVSETVRQDFAFVSLENLPSSLGGEVIFLVSFGPDQTQELLDSEVLANIPAVQAGNVFGLGPTSFRVDYYSALAMLEVIEAALG